MRDGEIYVMVESDDSDDEDDTVTPNVYAGLTWNPGREGKRISDSKWEQRVRAASLSLDWDKNIASVTATRPLREIVEAGSTIAQQAKVLPTWAHESIRTALELPGPPDVDHEETD